MDKILLNGYLIVALISFLLGAGVIVFLIRLQGGKYRYLIGLKGPEAEEIPSIRGINYLVSGEIDQAIQEFTKSVRVDSDSVDTYLALGILFRARGDLERAIWIHQGIVVRPNLSKEVLIQAKYQLGLDYRQAGALERAISSFEDVIKDAPEMVEAYVQLEELYEEKGDWERAFSVQKRISSIRRTDDSNILAHLMAEKGKDLLSKGDLKAARKSLKRAISINRECGNAYLHLGDLYAREGHMEKAIDTWKKVLEVSPEATSLVYDRLEEAYFKLNRISDLEELLKSQVQTNARGIFVSLFLAKHLRKKGLLEEAVKELRCLLEEYPEALEPRAELIEILKVLDRTEEAIQEYEALLGHLTLDTPRFRCKRCGYLSDTMIWKCPQCRTWDTITHLIGYEVRGPVHDFHPQRGEIRS